MESARDQALVFDELERRVLGVLMEKAFTQASSYPLTLNAIVAGCNQKSNRHPVTELDENAVWRTLERLQERNLVTRILPPPGARADKFKHNVERELQWQSPLRAVMTELFLRGPQTPGELRTRCSRMVEFESLADVTAVLDTLRGWDPPLVASLPRAPGQSAVRYTHLCHPPDERPPAPDSTPPDASQDASAMPAPRAETREPPSSSSESSSQLMPAELEDLQAELADLYEQIAELRRRVETLEGRFGA